VIPVQEQVEKIRAAVYARGQSNLVIVGRIDARAIEGLQDTIARGKRYLEAGGFSLVRLIFGDPGAARLLWTVKAGWFDRR
jgi:2-methylisocitrate lyase-like PEP mutase family enzyme